MSKTTLTLPTGSHSYAPSSPLVVPVAVERTSSTSSTFVLPSGERVLIHDDVARSAGVVSYQLASGEIVTAIRATRPVYAADDPRAFSFDIPREDNPTPFGPPAANDRIRTRRGPR